MTINNPILKGFNPDPSICRHGEDYYIATSTFEWFPGVAIYHSKDLKNWKLVSRPLNRLSQLNMLGDMNSGGIWAPALSHSNGKFWLIYTDVKVPWGAFKDCRNYLTTCDTIDGEWSEPIYLNASGFDPSLFHDDDGRQYLVNMQWDYRASRHSFNGIILQQYSHYRARLVGEPVNIFPGSEFKVTEAPHLYKIDGYYYLITAEGGTGYGHMATIARSKNIEGPYEIHPENPLISARFDKANPLQKAGHASMVQTHTDEWFLVYLMGRPIRGDGAYENKYAHFNDEDNLDRGYCPLGRETSIARLTWKDGWPWVEGGNSPKLTIKGPQIEEQPFAKEAAKDHFFLGKLPSDFQTLRIPLGDDIINLKERDSHVRIYGRESLASTFTQAHIARRWESLSFEASTSIEFNPKTYQHGAGLSSYYNTENWTCALITLDEVKGRIIDLHVMDNRAFSQPIEGNEVVIPDDVKAVHIKVIVDNELYSYHYSFDGKNWHKIPVDLPTYKLSDDYAKGSAFTGAFAGMFCFDLRGQDGMGGYVYADFDYFEYKEH